jgi:hypothetical protein
MSTTELSTIEPILVVNQPAVNQLAVHQPAVNQLAVHQPAVNQLAVNQPAVSQLATNPQPEPPYEPEPLWALQPLKPEAPRKAYLCRHIFADGHQCGSRALRGENFCYYHYAHRVPVLANHRRARPKEGFNLVRLDGLDNHTSIQLSLAQVLGRIANNSIEPKRGWLLLYGLQIAGNNLKHARPTAEAPIPDSIVEDAVHGQLAVPEAGQPLPETLQNRMRALLLKDPNADIDALAEAEFEM